MSKINSIPATHAEHRVIKLRSEGMTIKRIMAETGVSERRVNALIKDIVKGKKTSKKAPKPSSPLSRAADRVFPLACSKHGIRDHELRSILHEEYGTTWDTSDGTRKSNYTSDTMTRLKAKVRNRAIAEDCNVIFTTDWIDEQAPRLSSNFLISAATDLISRMEEYVTEYMESHGTRREDNDEAAALDRRKQSYAVEQHLLSLAFKNYSPEPVERLLARTASLVGELEGAPDLRSAEEMNRTKPVSAKTDKTKYFPEPSGIDHFLDYAEQQGWLI